LRGAVLDLSHPGVRDVLKRMGPMLIGMGVYYLDVVLARRFLSELGLGAQSYFSWALRVCDFPQGIFVMALSTAALPSLSRLVARGDRDELGKTFAFGMKLAMFVAIPATALFVALAEPIVVLLFQRGAFDAESARETARALVAQGSGIFLVAAVRQLLAVYYALGDTRTPVLVAAADLAVFIGLALTLRGPLGHTGVSWAVSGASAAQALLLFFVLTKREPSVAGHGLFGSVLRVTLASLGAAIAARYAAGALSPELGAGGFARAIPGLAGTLLFALVFLLLSRLLKNPELEALSAALKRKLRRAA
jgi:putative peptidoglycan lipid II flippase